MQDNCTRAYLINLRRRLKYGKSSRDLGAHTWLNHGKKSVSAPPAPLAPPVPPSTTTKHPCPPKPQP